jgi:hypothetical protein
VKQLKIEGQTSNPADGRIRPGANRENRLGKIDIVAHDPKCDEAVLVMDEAQIWDGSDAQLHELQERFNAYVSFLLDGEMAETHPELAGKKARIEVRCAEMPDARALNLLGLIHDQLAFQDIKMEVVVRDDKSPSPGAVRPPLPQGED